MSYLAMINTTTTIRLATLDDLDIMMDIVDEAKQTMRNSGNFRQWVNGYPQRELLADDIARQQCYLMLDNDRAVALFVLVAGPDPTYATIEGGNWLDNDRPYHVIHRIASRSDSRNVMRRLLQFAFSVDHNIRIDTHADNVIMQHIMEREGFSYCGIIYVADGTPRKAYQKIIG